MIADKINKGDYYISKEVPSLIDLAIDVVAEHFDLYPDLANLKVQATIDKIINKTALTWPITVSGPHIESEVYWKKACQGRWKNLRPTDHGNSWKQTYLETHLEEILSKHPGGVDSNLIDTIMATRNYIMNLNIEEMPGHLDLKLLFHNIPCITKLKVTYGAKRLGAEYDRARFGMRMDDAANLAECISSSQCLSFLSLPCNIIDDELIKMIVQGLLYNFTLMELDLSHNRIGDEGARRIAMYLIRNKVLRSLDLGDNCIQYQGSRYISLALRNNSSLQTLSLKHNRLDDKSGARLCKDLQNNSSLSSLNLSANMLSIQFCERLSELLSGETGLKHLDISCNQLVDPEAEDLIRQENIEAVRRLKDVLLQNCVLTKLDVRNNNLPPDLNKELPEIVVKHELDLRDIPLFKIQTPAPSEKAASRAPSRASQAEEPK